MNKINEFRMTVDSKSVNESFTRVVVSAFVTPLDPTLEEIADLKTAVSEAVTNCIVHAYKERTGYITIQAKLFEGGEIQISVRDKGCGIPDVPRARQPMFTTGDAGRSGMGFTIMESFMDKLRVRSREGIGTQVVMTKRIAIRFGQK